MPKNLHELAVGFAVLGIVWISVLRQLRSGMKTGEMVYWKRRGGADPPDDHPTGTVTMQEAPISFWCLTAFYAAITILVPILIAVVWVKNLPE